MTSTGLVRVSLFVLLARICCISCADSWQKSTKQPRERLSHLLDDNYFSDVLVTVTEDGISKTFPLHRLVLAMTSPVWAEMLYREDGTTPLSISIDDVPIATFAELTEYAYKNELNLFSAFRNWELKKAAERYEIEDLVQKTNEQIRSPTVETALQYLELAVQSNDTQVEQLCLKKISEVTAEVLEQQSFLSLTKDNLQRILKRPLLHASETQLFNALIQWANVSVQVSDISLREAVSPFLKYIDFESMTPSEFMTTVQPTGVLGDEATLRVMTALLGKVTSSSSTHDTSGPRDETKTATVRRCPDTPYNYTSYLPEHHLKMRPDKSNALTFTAKCYSSQCYLRGLQLTEEIVGFDKIDKVNLVVSSDNNANVLTETTLSLESPFIVEFEELIPIKNETEYRVSVDRPLGEGEYFHYLPWIHFREKCYKNVEINPKINVHFADDPYTENHDTTVEYGLFPTFFFVVW